MDGIKESKLFPYERKVQFYDPGAANKHVDNKIKNKVKEWFSTLKQSVTGEVKVENNDGHEIKPTNFPLRPGTIEETLKYKVFRHQRRNVTMVFIMETPMHFNDIKAPMLTWLKKGKYMMTRHNFNTKPLKSSRLASSLENILPTPTEKRYTRTLI
jgi:hypothetical protein